MTRRSPLLPRGRHAVWDLFAHACDRLSPDAAAAVYLPDAAIQIHNIGRAPEVTLEWLTGRGQEA